MLNDNNGSSSSAGYYGDDIEAQKSYQQNAHLPLNQNASYISQQQYDFDQYPDSVSAPNNSMKLNDDLDIMIRHGFIRKVFSLLLVQLLVTFGSIAFCNYNEGVKAYLDGSTGENHTWPIWLGFSLSMGVIIALVCYGDAARRHPTNLILLSVFTLSESLLLSVITVFYTAESIFMAVGATMGVVLVLIAFSYQTKYDFTGMGAYLLTALFVLIFFGFFAAVSGSEIANLLYSSGGALIFCMYIVHDTQLIVGGRHKKFQFGVDDYVFAALNLYLDIINLFVHLLRIFGNRR